MERDYALVSPAMPRERIISLDVLRGFAVLGILVMNIQSFSMISAAYMNPAAYGDLTGINKWVWVISHILANAKFMAIFSMLFGAGVILFSEKAILKGRRAGGLHFRRMFWLFVFGMIHAYFIWYGDILVTYALCGMIVFLFRKKSLRTLIIWSVIFLLIPSMLYLGSGYTIPNWPEETYQQNFESWQPSQETIDHEVQGMQGGFLEQMPVRVSMAVFMQTFLFFYYSGWRALGLMLLGMFLYRLGVLTLQKTNRFYVRMIIFGLIPGMALIVFGIYENFSHKWSFDYSMFFGMQYNYWGSIGVALAYTGIVMLFCRSNIWKRLNDALAATGRMAFTNYILQSLICVLLFYGTGFGLFGRVERIYQALIVVAVWIIIIIFSKLWLSYYRFGPLEWLWRSLVYWKRQPNLILNSKF